VSAAPHRAAAERAGSEIRHLPRLGLPRTAASAVRAIRKARAKLGYPSAKKKFEQNKKSFRFARKPASIWRSTSFDPPVLPAGQLSIKNVQKKL
jgi:hypothetical protein